MHNMTMLFPIREGDGNDLENFVLTCLQLWSWKFHA